MSNVFFDHEFPLSKLIKIVPIDPDSPKESLPSRHLLAKLVVAQRAILEFQFIDLRDRGAEVFHHPRVFVSEEFFEKPADHCL